MQSLSGIRALNQPTRIRVDAVFAIVGCKLCFNAAVDIMDVRRFRKGLSPFVSWFVNGAMADTDDSAARGSLEVRNAAPSAQLKVTESVRNGSDYTWVDI